MTRRRIGEAGGRCGAVSLSDFGAPSGLGRMRRIRSVSDPLGRIFDAPFSRMARTCSRMCPRDNASEGDREVARGSMSHVSDLNKEPQERRGCEPCLHILPSRFVERQGSFEPEARPSLGKVPRCSLSTEENA